jgi:hypothetical protein
VFKSRDSSVGKATGYGLDGRGVGSSSLGRGKIFLLSTSSRPVVGPIHPTIQWVPGSSFKGGKAARAWSWPLTSDYCGGQENVELYIDSPIHLHGVLINYSSTGTILPFTFSYFKCSACCSMPRKLTMWSGGRRTPTVHFWAAFDVKLVTQFNEIFWHLSDKAFSILSRIIV